LSIDEKTLDPDHPDIATALNNLATLNYYLGANDKAESLYIRALEIYETSYGKDHPFVATVLVNMVEFYEEIGRKDEAEIFAERVKQIQSRYQ
jgi:tetratricopeptide (TPR) repeat protein